MFIEAGLVASLVVGGYFAVKHYGSATIVAAAKAELVKVEGEVTSGTLLAAAKADALAVVARLKASLGLK